ncbi:protein VASCULATURE COMPLEXITY AND CONNECTIVITY-like [Miscanthus floridulus]|uniref:protein VASCULATURE COMPLEXITY AND CONNECTIVITY-like n=1 Tax=Miscanthus floridulus TaxID=154761 RepID=UPI00345804D8
MDIGAIVLSLVVGLFGLASAVLGFIAERTKLTGHDIDIDVYTGECDYPANPAYLLALIAIPLLAVAMIIASLASGCCGCCRPRHGASESKRVTGIVCAVLSWIAALIAGVIYANGVAWNLPVTRYDSWCRLLRDGYLRMAALLSLAATALAITSYSMLRAQAAPAPAPAAAGASEPKPDGSYPPAAEAIAIPTETQWSAPQRHGQWQEPLPEVPRHHVGGYNYNRTPCQEMASHPRRQAQPAVEAMMA